MHACLHMRDTTDAAGVYQFSTTSALYMWAFTPSSCGPGATTAAGVLCPLGHYCIRGVPALCAAGMYGSSTGLTSASCTSTCSCTAGTFCPAGSSAGPTAGCVSCLAGAYCTGGSANAVYCTCRAGTACLVGSSSAVCQACPIGYYCASAVNNVYAVPCPAGYASMAPLSGSKSCAFACVVCVCVCVCACVCARLSRVSHFPHRCALCVLLLESCDIWQCLYVAVCCRCMQGCMQNVRVLYFPYRMCVCVLCDGGNPCAFGVRSCWGVVVVQKGIVGRTFTFMRAGRMVRW
jgi:hypothetical protein